MATIIGRKAEASELARADASKEARWMTIHGLALNINSDLNFFNYIVPYGIADKGVTSMQAELGSTVDADAVKREFSKQFEIVFEALLVAEPVVPL